MGSRRQEIAVSLCLLFIAAFCVAGDNFPDNSKLSAPTGPYLGQKPPGDTPVLFAPGIISTGKEHSAAMFTPDGGEVWFGRMFPATIYCMKMVEGDWTAPQVAAFCDTFNYLYPVLSPDGRRIFFTSDRPVEQQGARLSRAEGQLWMVERIPDGWTPPHHVGGTINFGDRQSCGSLAANGNMYFSAKVNKNPPSMYCSPMIGGSYAAPRELDEITGDVPAHCPFVAPDESYLIFSSFRGGLGRSDLFISFRNRDGTWSEPRNMGPTINSAWKDEYPYVSPDGKYLLFNSNRPSALNSKPIPDGPGNIYWISAAIIEKLK